MSAKNFLKQTNRRQEIAEVVQLVPLMFNQELSLLSQRHVLSACKVKKRDCSSLHSAVYQYPLAAVIIRDRGQEGLDAKHSIVYRVNKGLVSVHDDPRCGLFKAGQANVHFYVGGLRGVY